MTKHNTYNTKAPTQDQTVKVSQDISEEVIADLWHLGLGAQKHTLRRELVDKCFPGRWSQETQEGADREVKETGSGVRSDRPPPQGRLWEAVVHRPGVRGLRAYPPTPASTA